MRGEMLISMRYTWLLASISKYAEKEEEEDWERRMKPDDG
jgi:hypothetical protein